MMKFNETEKMPFDVAKAIRERESTRTFEPKPLSPEDKAALLGFYESQTNPFGVEVRVQYVSKETGGENVKLGTYGTIKGAKDFLALTVKDQPFAMEAVGYQFENFVLKATDMGLGTVWLAATFSRKDFERSMEIKDGELFPCICPIGYPLGRRSILERVTRASLGSKNRKAWSKIFFDGDFDHPLSENASGAYRNALEMLRLAPSATNSQPWAVVKEGNEFHFFNDYKAGVSSDVEKIKHVDLGIALSHFHQTALQDGLNGKFEIRDIKFDFPENMHYVLSFCASVS
ncbi:MAG: nitroreductase family protein [Treponema sp.]|nr:nitroreductase family protein [Treponema sp.]